jgi:hypothetical protein
MVLLIGIAEVIKVAGGVDHSRDISNPPWDHRVSPTLGI